MYNCFCLHARLVLMYLLACLLMLAYTPGPPAQSLPLPKAQDKVRSPPPPHPFPETQNLYDPSKDDIITAASCTTNCLAPVVKVGALFCCGALWSDNIVMVAWPWQIKWVLPA